MSDVPLSFLVGALFVLILLSAGFSASETGIMTLNRYRLRHLAKSGHGGARRALRLLQRPDRLIGLILLGNNFVNIAASSVATLIALRLGGEGYIAAATFLLTFIILIFSEVAPKTLAALHPERIAFPASHVLTLLLRLLYPLVVSVNSMANAVLRLFGIDLDAGTHSISREELRTIVNEAGVMIPHRHQKMLVNILDLDTVTVEDIMVPRAEIVGIDLEDTVEDIASQLSSTQYTRLPVFRGSIEQVEGIVHVRRLLPLVLAGDFSKEQLIARMREPYFIPEGTPLHTQLLNFQRNRRRIGLVVDEYGDILGLATVEDILEEIVGDFTSDPLTQAKDIQALPNGSFMVEGSTSVRELNRVLDWNLPTDGPKTLNGVILEQLEAIPEAGVSLKIAGMPVTILQTSGYKVKTAQVLPAYRR
ncbi:MAG TPA: HlyC/CorC family transporter [Gammaproteobacteria bacterium]|nr:HlyC/CorC family transporter [Gammaproteobacteria bacterium]